MTHCSWIQWKHSDIFVKSEGNYTPWTPRSNSNHTSIILDGQFLTFILGGFKDAKFTFDSMLELRDFKFIDGQHSGEKSLQHFSG